MNSYFFRVEHDLLRSEAFKTLGGSAIKVYLVIGLYSDFGTDWAYPSIRTIARQAGLSRQTVLAAIEQLSPDGPPGHQQGEGAVHGIQDHPPGAPASRTIQAGDGREQAENLPGTGPRILEVRPRKCPRFFRRTPSKWSKIWTGRGPSRSARRARRAGPNESQHRKKTRQHQSRFRERPFA